MKSDAIIYEDTVLHEAKPVGTTRMRGISHNSWDKKKTKLDIAQISANDKLGMGDVALRAGKVAIARLRLAFAEQDTGSLKGSHAMRGVYQEKENAE